jgi:hypothetical protein
MSCGHGVAESSLHLQICSYSSIIRSKRVVILVGQIYSAPVCPISCKKHAHLGYDCQDCLVIRRGEVYKRVRLALVGRGRVVAASVRRITRHVALTSMQATDCKSQLHRFCTRRDACLSCS